MGQRLAPSLAIAFMSKVEAPVMALRSLLYCLVSTEFVSLAMLTFAAFTSRRIAIVNHLAIEGQRSAIPIYTRLRSRSSKDHYAPGKLPDDARPLQRDWSSLYEGKAESASSVTTVYSARLVSTGEVQDHQHPTSATDIRLKS
ncbi:hypothetical protein KIN20_036211 [Parelaphostrongylus tenuis]|uniref:Uncharacterized protein n=1 Tax=Parelaphostrongylus tenuis TaxID=148309 RepID=A0AAD5RCZ8_PARTN|nr:hypothetical protein KIN20_036211 [Parelaphostrongylus tenuis]